MSLLSYIRGLFRVSLPALPVFSLCIDRLEAFLESNLLAHLTALMKCALRVTGMLLPSLVFADNTMFLDTQQVIAQCILDTFVGLLCLKLLDS